jgi:hypothetical protein
MQRGARRPKHQQGNVMSDAASGVAVKTLTSEGNERRIDRCARQFLDE